MPPSLRVEIPLSPQLPDPEHRTRRYLDSMAIVSQTWAARAKAQAQMGDSDGGGFM